MGCATRGRPIIKALNLDRLVQSITAIDRGQRSILVGIDGPGASGKSTLAEMIRRRMDSAVVVHVDEFFLPSAVRDSRAGQTGELFDLPRLERQVLVPARGGSAFTYQRYDWADDSLAEHRAVPAAAPVIVEGVYALSRRLRGYYSYTIYCCADHDLRLQRGVERDGESMRATWTDEWMPQEARYEAREDPRSVADLVVDSSQSRTGVAEFGIVDASPPHRAD